ncbi:hypothetical protein AB0B57_18125 [Micromonospora sp. NPDC049101]|uniref:hypothetical protein n=1 Tax=unclassified Micromonospora TaxID=2617518 RepID=UPI0033E4E464
MPSRNNGRSAPTEVDFTTTERQPDPSDERRGHLKIHLKGVEWESGNLSSAAVIAVVGLFLAGGIAGGTVLATHNLPGDTAPLLLGGGTLVVLIIAATIILALSQSEDRRRQRTQRGYNRSSERGSRGRPSRKPGRQGQRRDR